MQEADLAEGASSEPARLSARASMLVRALPNQVDIAAVFAALAFSVPQARAQFPAAPAPGNTVTCSGAVTGVATITNDGTIRVTTAQGTAIAASNAAITNNATGSISGATNGISITGGAGTGSVTNSGTIQAMTGPGVIFTLGGTVNN